MKKFIFLISLLTLTACSNTVIGAGDLVQGIGKDISAIPSNFED